MNESFKRKKSDYLLELALEECLNQDRDILTYPSGHEAAGLHSFSPEHQKRMKKIFRQANRMEHRSAIGRRRIRMAAGIAIFLCVSTVAVSEVEAVRLPVMRFFIELSEKAARLKVEDEEDFLLSGEYQQYEPTYIPEGYVVTSVKERKGSFHIRYEQEHGHGAYQFFYNEKNVEVELDTENAITNETRINGMPAFTVQKGDEVRIFMHDGEHTFLLDGKIDFEDALKVMESIKN